MATAPVSGPGSDPGEHSRRTFKEIDPGEQSWEGYPRRAIPGEQSKESNNVITILDVLIKANIRTTLDKNNKYRTAHVNRTRPHHKFQDFHKWRL